jgi:DNA (cytosine-5)-methyltransferase 1
MSIAPLLSYWCETNEKEETFATMSHYGVPIARGVEIKLKAHKRECSLLNLRSYVAKTTRPLALDLFCGAGGLSLGLEEAGFDVILGVDRYDRAIATHRANFGGVSLCGDISDPRQLRLIKSALKDIPISLIAGGPPCQPFSRAGKNKIRSLGNSSGDRRRELWRSFVCLVKQIKPQYVLIENVPDLAYGDSSVIFRQIVNALEVIGYNVESRFLNAWQFGVPQHRQRLFIVAYLNGLSFHWPPTRTGDKVTVRDAISDLPAVVGGGRQIELPYGEPKSLFQQRSRRRLSASQKRKIHDHLTRSVRDDDLEAFRLMTDGSLYSDLPKHLRRYRADIFEDKYKRLAWDGLSRSITAHIGKDGYWYIHPEQHRTLTIREAARIQTFPDHFRFAGSPSHAFRQIGEAVPPELAKALGRAIRSAINSTPRSMSCPSTLTLSRVLLSWFKKLAPDKLVAPWRRSRDAWQVLLGTLLGNGRKGEIVKWSWRMCNDDWSSPEKFLSDRRRQDKLNQHSRQNDNKLLTVVAKHLVDGKESVPKSFLTVTAHGSSAGSFKIAKSILGIISSRPVTSPAARVVERLFGVVVNSSRTYAELLIGRVVGVDETGLVYAALLETGELFCKPKNPNCDDCPLGHLCKYSIDRSRKTRDKPD